MVPAFQLWGSLNTCLWNSQHAACIETWKPCTKTTITTKLCESYEGLGHPTYAMTEYVNSLWKHAFRHCLHCLVQALPRTNTALFRHIHAWNDSCKHWLLPTHSLLVWFCWFCIGIHGCINLLHIHVRTTLQFELNCNSSPDSWPILFSASINSCKTWCWHP